MFGYFFGTEGRWPQSQLQPASVPDSAGLSPSPYWPQSQPLLASPPTPLRMERGVVCEVTPFGLLKEGEGMPNGRRESYEAVPRRPEQQGTEEPALSMSPVFSVPLLPCLKQTLSCLSPLLLPELVHLLPCLKHTLSLSQTYPAPVSALCYSQNLFICYFVFLIPCLPIHLTLSPYPPYPTPTLSQKK